MPRTAPSFRKVDIRYPSFTENPTKPEPKQVKRKERVSVPKTGVVDVKSVGSGDKALVYLGRYLYSHRDVVSE